MMEKPVHKQISIILFIPHGKCYGSWLWKIKMEANEDVIFTLLFVSEIVNVFVKFFNTNVFYEQIKAETKKKRRFNFFILFSLKLQSLNYRAMNKHIKVGKLKSCLILSFFHIFSFFLKNF